jgi:hypothetical protein
MEMSTEEIIHKNEIELLKNENREIKSYNKNLLEENLKLKSIIDKLKMHISES